MNAAKLSKSQRLKRVYNLLSDGRPHSTLDSMKRASVCAVSAIVAELRANGKTIVCKRHGDVWFYVLVRGKYAGA